MDSDQPISECEKLGPAARWMLNGLLTSVIFMPAAAIAVFGYVRSVRAFLYSAMEFSDGAQSALAWYYSFQKTYDLREYALWIGIFNIAYVVFRQITTSYTANEDYVYIAEGLFRRYTNTVKKTMIYDCDITQNLFQVIFGTGNLVIRTVDHQTILLHYIPHPEVRRDELLGDPSANNLRVIGSI